MTEPIRPNEVVSAKEKILPNEILEVFNELIAKHWCGSFSRFTQKEAQELICNRMQCRAKYLFDNHYMDIEDIYEAVGWKVYYDRPAYCESYDATYRFSKE